MVSRTYTCLNRNCRNTFTSQEDHPPCPRCKGMRVQWQPMPVAIGKGTRGVDQTVRGLAESYGMTNFRSPVRDAPAVAPTAMSGRTTGTFEPQPGWKINMPDEALSGSGRAICAPTGVTAKIRPAFDAKMSASKTLGAGSKIEGSYRPKGGIPS